MFVFQCHCNSAQPLLLSHTWNNSVCVPWNKIPFTLTPWVCPKTIHQNGSLIRQTNGELRAMSFLLFVSLCLGFSDVTRYFRLFGRVCVCVCVCVVVAVVESSNGNLISYLQCELVFRKLKCNIRITDEWEDWLTGWLVRLFGPMLRMNTSDNSCYIGGLESERWLIRWCIHWISKRDCLCH